jgi:hypothetical protein
VSSADLRQQLARALAELEALAARPPEELLGLDLSARDRELRALVRRVGDALGGRAAAQRA